MSVQYIYDNIYKRRQGIHNSSSSSPPHELSAMISRTIINNVCNLFCHLLFFSPHMSDWKCACEYVLSSFEIKLYIYEIAIFNRHLIEKWTESFLCQHIQSVNNRSYRFVLCDNDLWNTITVVVRSIDMFRIRLLLLTSLLHSFSSILLATPYTAYEEETAGE